MSGSHCRTSVKTTDASIMSVDPTFKPAYSRWRHGGWYVHNVRYPSGACGCVSNNYPDNQWRIVCDPRREGLGEPGDYTYPTREAAALAEYAMVTALQAQENAASVR